MRTVGVKLVAEYRDYVTGVEASAKVTDDFTTELEKAAKAGDETAVATEVFGKTAKTAAGHVEKLDHEIKQAERELRQLAVAFAEAGTAAERADLSKGIRNTNSELSKLKKNQNVLKDLLPDAGEAKQFEKTFSSTISGAIENAKVGPVLLVGIAAAAPLIGATISAAVIGAAGVGGVLGGVLLAARDPRVKAAGTELGKNLLSELEKDAKVFVDPVLVSIGKIEARFGQMNTRISHIFAGSSGFLAPLVDGALEGVDGILRGIDSLVTKGKPVIDQLGHSFGQIGNAVGDALKTISGDSEDSAKALQDLTNAISITVRGVGYLVRGLTELYGPVTSLPHLWTDFAAKLLGWEGNAKAASTTSGVLADLQKKLTPLVLSAGEAAGKAGMQMQTYADKMDEASAKGRGLYDSQTDVAQAVADATKAIKENGKTLDINTQKGRDNRKALSGVAEKLVATYDAYVKVNGEGAAAGRVAERNRDQFVKLARQFGLGSKAANDLADSMGLIKPKSVDVHVNTHDAVGRANAARDAINRIHGKTVTVHVSVTGTERLDALGHRIGGAATGGPIEGPGTTTSDSIPMMLSRGEHVWTAREVAAAGGQAAVSALRASVLSGSRAMPSNFGPQKIIVESRSVIEFAGGADAFGQLMANVLRVKPGIRQTIAQTLGVKAA